MNLSAAARAGALISILSACAQPAMAQHNRAAGHPATGGHPAQGLRPGNAGMGHVNPQAMQQQQRMIEQQQRAHMQQMQQMQHQAQQQYQKQVQQFENFLKSKGQAGASSRLPKDPEGFDNWAATQKRNKAQGKSYDPLYDHFRSFADGTAPNQGQAKAGAQAKNGQPGHDAKTAAAHEKTVAREKRAEANRQAAAHKGTAKNQGKLPLAQDQPKISMLRNVHTQLQQADHDYDGHRVRAMHEVRQAIQHLGASAPSGNGSGPGNLAQGVSDGILRESLHHLRNVEAQLVASGGGVAHHSRARASVGLAIHHLETALRIR